MVGTTASSRWPAWPLAILVGPLAALAGFCALLLINALTCVGAATGSSAPWQQPDGPYLTSNVDRAQPPALGPPEGVRIARGDRDHAGALSFMAVQNPAPDHRPGPAGRQVEAETNATGWHPTRIETTELVPLAILQPGRLAVVRHPALGASPALAKVAADAHEASVYRLLHGLGVAPRFLGHATEGGRVVGLLTEYVGPPPPPPPRGSPQRDEPEPEPAPARAGRRRRRREACLGALRRMHARGIAHGDAHGGNCLLRADGSAALVDFELSVETASRAELDRDLWVMSHTVDD